MKKRKHFFKVLTNMVIIAMGIGLYGLMLHFSDESLLDLLARAIRVDLYFPIAITIVIFIIHLLLSWRWALLLGCFEDIDSIPRGFIFYNTNIGILMASVLPTVAYAGTKALSFKIELNIPASKTICAGVLEALAGMTAALSLMIPGTLYLFDLIPVHTAFILYFCVILLLIFTFYGCGSAMLTFVSQVCLSVFRIIEKLPFIKKTPEGNLFDPRMFMALQKKTTLQLIFVTLLIYHVSMLKYYILLIAFDISMDFMTFVLVFPIGYLIASMGVTPGNIGVAELAWFSILTFVSVTNNNAALYSVGQRIFSQLALIIITILSYLFYATRKKSCDGHIPTS